MKRVISMRISDVLADRLERYKGAAKDRGGVMQKILECGLDAAELTLSKGGLTAALENQLVCVHQVREEAAERELLLLARAANCHDQLIAIAKLSLDGKTADQALLMSINESGHRDEVVSFVRQLVDQQRKEKAQRLAKD